VRLTWNTCICPKGNTAILWPLRPRHEIRRAPGKSSRKRGSRAKKPLVYTENLKGSIVLLIFYLLPSRAEFRRNDTVNLNQWKSLRLGEFSLNLRDFHWFKFRMKAKGAWPNLTLYCPAMPFGNRKKYFWGSFQFSIVSIWKKYHPSGNLKFYNLGILKSLKLRILVKKNSSHFFLS